jgi:hypothetical protein
MREKKILLVFTILIILITIGNTIFLLYETGKSSYSHMSGKSVGIVKFCFNHRPAIQNIYFKMLKCYGPPAPGRTEKAYVDQVFYCKVNATDVDYNGSFTFTSTFINGTPIPSFTISTSGIINFTPSSEDTGNYTIVITADDNYHCENSFGDGDLYLEVIGNNTMPRINLSNCSSTIYQNQNFRCKVNVTDPDVTGNFTYNISFILMQKTFSVSDDAPFITIENGIINFTPNNSFVGEYKVNITVGDNKRYRNSNNSAVYNFTIINVNDAPVFNGPIPNQSWQQDTVLITFDLDSYFSDLDLDALTYRKSLPNNIEVTIDENNVVTFTPIPGWAGSEFITFFAFDPYNANVSSNDILLIVYPIAQQMTTQPGGGSGGAGGISKCIPEWYCNEWEVCLKEAYQIRMCTDLHSCGTQVNKPNVTQACNYIATCYDGIKDGTETGVDCGGLCLPCPSCSDRIKNQGEFDIDCGGPCNVCAGCDNGIMDGYETGVDCGGPYCKSCPSCFDGIKNQGETGVDCGDPCEPCKEIEVPIYLKERNNFLTTILISSILLLAILLILYKFAHQHIKKFLAKLNWLMAGKKKRKKEKLLLEVSASKSILDELDKLERRIKKDNVQDLSSEFSKIIKKYFKDLFKVGYEFTNEELIKEMKLKKLEPELEKILIELFTKSSEIEYARYNISKTELQTLIDEAREIVNLTSLEDKNKENKQKEEINLEEKDPKLNEVEKMLVSVSNSQKLLQNNKTQESMKLYMDLLDSYNKLPEKDKSTMYPHLSRLYGEIKLASKKKQ